MQTHIILTMLVLVDKEVRHDYAELCVSVTTICIQVMRTEGLQTA